MTELSRATIEGFIADLDREIIAHRAQVKARKNVRRFLRKMLRSTNSAASTQERPRPMEGAADRGEVRPGLAANQSTAARMDAPNQKADGHGAVNAAGAGTQAPPVDTNSPETADAGEVGPETVGASPAQSLLSRVRAYMGSHPDSTARECADALGVDTVKVRNTARGVIVFAPTRSPVHRRADQEAAEGDEDIDEAMVAPDAERQPTGSPGPAIAFVPPTGEMSERTAKRIEVADLHRREPWLTPDEAAARLLIPIVNLRIFTDELEIAWSQPRAASPPVEQAPLAQPRTLRDRVMAMHRMHPTWGAGMISRELGCAYGSASTYLAEARRVENELPPAPINREVA